MPIRKLFLPDNIRDLIKSDFKIALFTISAYLESILTEKIHFEKGISFQKMEKWTLGTAISECKKYGFFNEEQNKLLSKFKEFRNKAIHWRGLIERGLANDIARSKAEFILNEICDFIESVEIKYSWNRELEKDYSEDGRRQDKWFSEFFELT